MSQDVDLSLAYEDVDFEKLCEFIGCKVLKGQEGQQYAGWWMWAALEISLIKQPEYTMQVRNGKKLHSKGYLTITTEYQYHFFVTHLIALAIAKYVVTDLKGGAFCTDGEWSFFYDQNGLTLTSNWLNPYRFPPTSTHRFENLTHTKYDHLRNISQNFNNSTDIVIHVLEDFFDDRWYEYLYNDDHPEKDTLPPKGQFISYALPIGYLLLTVQKKAWQYHQTIQNDYPISFHFRASAAWRDVMILQIMANCVYGNFYSNGQYNEIIDKPIIVSTGDGEIIFLFKQNEFVINSKWQKYFSKFPIGVDEYCIDDTL